MAILKKLSSGIAALALTSTAFAPAASAAASDRKHVRADKGQSKSQKVRRTGPAGIKAYGGGRTAQKDRGKKTHAQHNRGHDRSKAHFKGDRKHHAGDRKHHAGHKKHNAGHYKGDRKHHAGGHKGHHASHNNHYKGQKTHYRGHDRHYKGHDRHHKGHAKHYSGGHKHHGYKHGYSKGYKQGYHSGHRSAKHHHYKPRVYHHGHYKPRYAYKPVYAFYRPHRIFKHYAKPLYHHRYHPRAHYVPRYTIGGYYGYHSNTIILSNYRYYDLYDPPHGYHWVRDYDSGDAILASIATGAVIGLIIGAIASH